MPAIAALNAPHPKQAITQRNAGSSPLLKLPLEIRIMIYELATHVDGPIRPWQMAAGSNKFFWGGETMQISNGLTNVRHRDPLENLTVTELARSCRMIYHDLEAKPVFYRANSFHFEGLKALHAFLAAITPARRGSIRRIVIEDKDPNYSGRKPWSGRDDSYSRVMPLLLQCDDLRQLTLRLVPHNPYRGTELVGILRHELNALVQWLSESPYTSDSHSFMDMPSLQIVLERRFYESYTRWNQGGNTEVVTIGPDWDVDAIHGSRAQPVCQALGAEITNIGKALASRKTLLSQNEHRLKVTDEQLMESIAAAGIHFPGEDRLHLNRLDSDIGAVSSRTRHRCNTANLNAFRGRLERKIGKYDSEGLLIESFSILDIRSVDPDIECRITVSYQDPLIGTAEATWEPIHALLTEDGIRQLQALYDLKLKDAVEDRQVMQSLPAPQDVKRIADAYIEGPVQIFKTPRRAYQRRWAALQTKFEARVKKWAPKASKKETGI
ncbi:hypothetical protein PG993_001843 [Apiospora rasikravindrae]|uniref:DUF7730 domain-containing protein n=1 Tax=Apiospora rasikravindrae TaxID=990691 RepID=A0ABR1UER5_9PEZI